MSSATWEGMNDARFWISLADVKGMTTMGLQVYLYGVADAEFERVKAKWTELLVRLFPRAASGLIIYRPLGAIPGLAGAFAGLLRPSRPGPMSVPAGNAPMNSADPFARRAAAWASAF